MTNNRLRSIARKIERIHYEETRAQEDAAFIALKQSEIDAKADKKAALEFMRKVTISQREAEWWSTTYNMDIKKQSSTMERITKEDRIHNPFVYMLEPLLKGK